MTKFLKLTISAVAVMVALSPAFAVKDAKQTTKTVSQKKHAAKRHGKAPMAATPVGDKAQGGKTFSARERARGKLGLEISGGIYTNFYSFKNKVREPNGGKGRGTHIGVNDSRINFEVSGFTNQVFQGYNNDFNELYYSFLIGMNGSGEPNENPIEEARIKLKGRWGTFLIGQHRGPTDFMAAGPFTFVGGTGGMTGNFKTVLNETTGSVLRDDLGHKLTPKNANKVTFVTPRAYGFQVGYAFSPDNQAKGDTKVRTHTRSGDMIVQTIHEAAISFKENFQGVGVNVALTGMHGKSKASRTTNDPRRNLNAASLGAVFDYKGFSIGSEYLNNFKSGELKKLEGVNAGKVWTIGAGYSFGANAISLSRLQSKRKLGSFAGQNFGKVKSETTALTYDRDLAPGLGVYIEGVDVKMKTGTSRTDLATWHNTINNFRGDVVERNKSKQVITGVKMKF